MSTKLFKESIIGVEWDYEPEVKFVVGAKSDKLALTKDWEVRIIYKSGSKEVIIIKKGFRFEGSVPFWVWTASRVTNTTPEALPGWCLHDFLYILVKYNVVDRAEADLCLKFCLQDRFNFVQVNGVYYSVRSFGWMYVRKPATEAEEKDVFHILHAVFIEDKKYAN